MPTYQVEINGQNFLVDVEGQVARHGFFTHRVVKAADVDAAAVEAIRQDAFVRDLVQNSPDDPPVMDVTEIIEIASSEPVDPAEPGFIWYPEQPKCWWQFWKR